MQTQISVFQFQAAQNVRVETKNGEPWFCLKDITDILEIKNHKDTALRLNPKGVEKIPLLTAGGKQELTFINEPNLYRVIFRSNKAEAVKFQDWIFEEVIPQIRKTGGYRLHLDRWLNTWECEQIRAAVKNRAQRTGETTQGIYVRLHNFMGVPAYEQIGASRFQDALNFLSGIADAPELFRQDISADDVASIGRLLAYAQDLRGFVRRYLPAFRNMDLRAHHSLYSHVYDTDATYRNVAAFFRARAAQIGGGQLETVSRHIAQTAEC